MFDEGSAHLAPEPPEATFLRDRLSVEDRCLLDDYHLFRSAGGGMRMAMTPEALLAAWERFVAQVETGYGDIPDEYFLSLSFRDALADALGLISPVSHRAVEPLVGPWDERFLDATDPSPISIVGSRTWDVLRWWWYRVPKVVLPNMERHLREAEARRSAR